MGAAPPAAGARPAGRFRRGVRVGGGRESVARSRPRKRTPPGEPTACESAAGVIPPPPPPSALQHNGRGVNCTVVLLLLSIAMASSGLVRFWAACTCLTVVAGEKEIVSGCLLTLLVRRWRVLKQALLYHGHRRESAAGTRSGSAGRVRHRHECVGGDGVKRGKRETYGDYERLK